MEYELKINGASHKVEAEADTPLLWVLRDTLKFTGTKFGCGMALCGACTVQLDGKAVRSCSLPVSAVADKSITTIENTEDKINLAVQEAWQEHQVAQCGYCQSGQIIAASALLKDNPQPSDEQIKTVMTGNICRCGTYVRVLDAIKTASKTLAKGVA